jgi:hypothetical protein
MSKQIGYQAAKVARKMDPEDIAMLIRGGNFEKLEELASMVDPTDISGAGSRFIANLDSRKEVPKKEEPIQPDLDYEELRTTGEKAQGEQVAETKPEQKPVNEKYQKRINDRMMKIYAENFSDQMPFDEFYSRVEKITNGFLPEKSAKILYDTKEERAKFKKDYSASQKLKGYSDAYGKQELGDKIFFGAFDKGKGEERAFKQKEIADTIAALTEKEGGFPAETVRKQVALDLKTINALKLTPEEKQNVLFQKLQDSYGLGVLELQELGLI